MFEYCASLCLAAICLTLFLFIWRVESGNTVVFTPFLVLMGAELLLVMPGFVYLTIKGTAKDMYPLLLFFIGFVSLLAGFIFSMACSRYRSSLPRRFIERKLRIDDEGSVFFAIICGCLILIPAGLYLYQGLPPVTKAILGFVKGEQGQEIINYVSLSRQQITKGHVFGGEYRGQGAIRDLMSVGWPFLSALSLCVYWKEGRKRWLCLSIILILLSFLFIAGEATRTGFLIAVFLYFILYSFVKKLGARFLIYGFCCLLLVGIVISLYSAKMYFMINRENFVRNVFSGICERIFLGNTQNDVYAINFVRDGTIHLRLGSLHWTEMLASLPGPEEPPFANELFLLLNPGQKGTTYNSGTYIAKAFVDFGIWGVVGLFFLIGFLSGLGQQVILKIKKTELNLSLAMFVSFLLGYQVIAGWINLISRMVVVLFFYVLLAAALRAPPHFRGVISLQEDGV